MFVKVLRALCLLPLLAVLSSFTASGCQSDLSSSLEGKLCDDGECLTGYVCDSLSHTCVKAGSGGGSCGEGLTTCGGECVQLKVNAEHCGGCGAVCTAPA